MSGLPLPVVSPTASPGPSPSPQLQRLPSPQADTILETEKPWQHVGYRRFSQWIASDQTFFVLRRFSALSARVGLALQDEIARIGRANSTPMDETLCEAPMNVDNGTFRKRSVYGAQGLSPENASR